MRRLIDGWQCVGFVNMGVLSLECEDNANEEGKWDKCKSVSQGLLCVNWDVNPYTRTHSQNGLQLCTVDSRGVVAHSALYAQIIILARYWLWLLDDVIWWSYGSNHVTVGGGFPVARQNNTALVPSNPNIIEVHMLIWAARCPPPVHQSNTSTLMPWLHAK